MLTPEKLFYEFCHRLGFFAGITLDGLDNCTANDRRISEFCYCREVLRCGNAEANGNGKLRVFAQATD